MHQSYLGFFSKVLIVCTLFLSIFLTFQCKSIITGFCFKPIEFDRLIWIMNLFPQAQKWNCRMIAHPVRHHNKGIVWIFIFCNISKWNVSIFINNIAHYSDFRSMASIFIFFTLEASPFCIFHFSFIFFFLWEILDHELPKFRNLSGLFRNLCNHLEMCLRAFTIA